MKMQSHKLDSKNPSVKIIATGGTDLQKWNKSVSLNAVADEDLYSYNAQNKLRHTGVEPDMSCN